MSNFAMLPSLFGRFSMTMKGHEQFGATLRRLRLMCSALERGQTPTLTELAPDQLLASLRTDLEEHFRAEESAEYFGTVVREVPTLARQIAALKWEHLCMLRTIDVLLGLVQDSKQWSRLAQPTRELLDEIERHERTESVLLRQFFAPPA